jgi:hypothetical protein
VIGSSDSISASGAPSAADEVAGMRTVVNCFVPGA